MDVMVTGSGAREHALAAAVSPEVNNLYIAPGNGGSAELGENVPIPAHDINGVVRFAVQNHVDLVVVGPDAQLAAGLVNELARAGIAAFGPSQQAAQVEWSKTYAKEIMTERGIPAAPYQSFANPHHAENYLETCRFPIVIKDDGLKQGKGVTIAENLAEAKAAVRVMSSEEGFGGVVIEAYLGGPENPEVSLHALTDGETYQMLPAAQDHKRIHDGHKGPMTGGMGTVAPLPGISDEQIAQYGEQIVAPLLAGLRTRGITYRGLLYPGIKLVEGKPFVLEYNARFGDPETSVYVPLLQSSLLEALIACHEGTLGQIQLQWRKMAAVCVVLASKDYPLASEKGVPIDGISVAQEMQDIHVFHAGTKRRGTRIYANGGRILNVVGMASTLKEARDRAYEAAEEIYFPGKQYRSDIGREALKGLWTA